MKFSILASAAALALTTGTMAGAVVLHTPANDDLTGFENKVLIPSVPSDFVAASAGATPLLVNSIGQQRTASSFVPSRQVVQSFEGMSQYDVANFGRNFVPPDSSGAVGTTQFTEFANGGVAVFSKTGIVQKAVSDTAFWTAAGQDGSYGDSRVMFDAAAGRWIATSFNTDLSQIQIAVSNTADATGTWQSTKFSGFVGAGGASASVADFPTLAFDHNAVYIGTNNFDANGFEGTTLNVIPLGSVITAGAPTTAGLTQINLPYSFPTADSLYAIQGVNSTANTTDGHILAASAFYTNNVLGKISNAGTAGQTLTAGYLNNGIYNGNNPARQPNAVPDAPSPAPQFIPNPDPKAPPGSVVPNPDYFPNNNRVVDTLDTRIGSSVYEVNGRIYSVQTVTPIYGDHTVIRYDVTDAATGNIISEGNIGDQTHDFYQGSINVNAAGEVVIGYNRSGSGADGKITFFAEVFHSRADGSLFVFSKPLELKVSVVDDYHQCSLDGGSVGCHVDGFVAAGRQRWGDYSQVTVDPNDPTKFWVVGEFAREYNDGVLHPVGTGGSRWGQWIAEIDGNASAPEPAAWMLMIAGFGLVGTMARRRRTGYLTA